MPHIKLTQGQPTGRGLYLSESEISPDLQWLIFSSAFKDQDDIILPTLTFGRVSGVSEAIMRHQDDGGQRR